MTRGNELTLAELVLRLGLGLEINSEALSKVPWADLLEVARENVLVVRTFERLCEMGVAPESEFKRAAENERVRIQATVSLIEATGEVCVEVGVPFVFTKAFSHFPDMGHDVDLLVLDSTDAVDRALQERFTARPASFSLANRIAGKTDYTIEGYPSPLEIHHARLGHVGEHSAFAEALIRQRRSLSISGITTYVPRSEDKIIIQVLQRIYAHMSISLSNVIGLVRAVREPLDWDYVIATAHEHGVIEGLRYLMGNLNNLCLQILDEDDWDPGILRLLRAGTSRDTHWSRGRYQFANLTVAGLYAHKLRALLSARRWSSAGRLCLLVPLAGVSAGRSVLRIANVRHDSRI